MSVTVEAPKPAALAAHVARLRQAVVESVSVDDISAVFKKLVDLAKEGDLRATRMVLHYTLGKPGTTSPEAALAPAPRSDARPAPAPFDVKSDTLLGGQTVSEQITRQIQQQQRAADNKQMKPSERKPMSVPPGHGCAKTEAMCLVNRPEGARP
jgi:hypothetical protein